MDRSETCQVNVEEEQMQPIPFSKLSIIIAADHKVWEKKNSFLKLTKQKIDKKKLITKT